MSNEFIQNPEIYISSKFAEIICDVDDSKKNQMNERYFWYAGSS